MVNENSKESKTLLARRYTNRLFQKALKALRSIGPIPEDLDAKDSKGVARKKGHTGEKEKAPNDAFFFKDP